MNVRGPMRAVAVGKAACAMWEGARDALEASLIVTKRGHVTPACAQAGVTMLEAGRALPLLISDAPGDAAADIGSGPLLPAHDEASFPIGELPAALQALFTQASSSVDTATFAHIETRLVARLDDALDAAAAAARSAGHEAYLLHHE